MFSYTFPCEQFDHDHKSFAYIVRLKKKFTFSPLTYAPIWPACSNSQSCPANIGRGSSTLMSCPRPNRSWLLKLLLSPTHTCPYMACLLQLLVLPRPHRAWCRKILPFPSPAVGPHAEVCIRDTFTDSRVHARRHAHLPDTSRARNDLKVANIQNRVGGHNAECQVLQANCYLRKLRVIPYCFFFLFLGKQ